MVNENSKYIGQGWSFPLRTDGGGRMKLVTGSEDIEQAIHIILETSPGERVMRPEFGCEAKNMVFSAMNNETFAFVQNAVKEALTMWEPRIYVRDVFVNRDPQNDSALLISIEYEINATHDTRNIVHPFYIEKEQEIN